MDAATQQQQQQEMKKCPACAELVLAEAKKCRHCGTRLDRGETFANIKRRVISIKGAVVLALVVLVAAAVVGYSNRTGVLRWMLGREIRAGIAEARPICEKAAQVVVGEGRKLLPCAEGQSIALRSLDDALDDPTYRSSRSEGLRGTFTILLDEPKWDEREKARHSGRFAYLKALDFSGSTRKPESLRDVTYAEAKAVWHAIAGGLNAAEEGGGWDPAKVGAAQLRSQPFVFDGVVLGMRPDEVQSAWAQWGTPKENPSTFVWPETDRGYRVARVNDALGKIHGIGFYFNAPCEDAVKQYVASFGPAFTSRGKFGQWISGTSWVTVDIEGTRCSIDAGDYALEPR